MNGFELAVAGPWPDVEFRGAAFLRSLQGCDVFIERKDYQGELVGLD
jgi:hypothetical protein